MVKLRNKYSFLWLSILISVGVASMQILGSTVGLAVVFILFGALIVFATVKDMAIPILMFFLPWSPLIKFAPGSISMYTVAIVAILLIFLLRSSKSFAIRHIFPAALLFVLTMIVKTVTNSDIDAPFILFFSCMLLFPLASGEKNKEYDFYTLVIFFSVGIISASLSAQQLVIFPSISKYIVVLEYNNMTRLSGYYGDPNFYAAHITAAISGAVLILLNEMKMIRKIIICLLLTALLYCGFLSVSKSFALILVCIVLLWVIEVLFKKGRISSKVMMLMALAVGGFLIMSSFLFADLLDMLLGRFIGASDSLSDFTTKRNDLWLSYLRTFDENPMILIFGMGFTDKLVGGNSSHNIIIQIVYQFGLIGLTFVGAWFWEFSRSVLRFVKLQVKHIIQILILMGGSLGPWLGLDLLMFDEFFIIPFFVFIGIMYLDKSSGDKSFDEEVIGEVAE